VTTRLFVDPRQLAEELLVLAGEDHRYLTRVLRLGVDDVVVLFDGRAAEADARIVRVGPRALELRVEARRAAAAVDRPDVTLLQALVKGDKFDFVVQKSSELGASRIIPVLTQRAVPRPEAGGLRTLGKRARWQKIAREAARQAGRADVLEVEPVTPLPVALAAAPKDALKLMLWEGAREHSLRQVLPAERPRRIVVAIGPEGGFTEEEAQAARAAGFHTVGMGPRILRTETAGLVALAILGFQLGDLG
jgi:16S rRNA (uracil1498-N3)-methyltransferase